MPNLIPLSTQQLGQQDIQTVNARDLHTFLQVKARFNDWIVRRIDAYGFVQDIDFVCYSDLSNTNQTQQNDYHLSLDMAKELSMVERTAKGKEARQYFLECERAVKYATPQLPAITFAYLGEHQAFLEKLGVFDDRDRLMIADIVRTQLQRQAGPIQAALPAPAGFDIEDGLRAVAPNLTASQLRKHTGQAGKRVAAEYRSRFGHEPSQTQRFVDGKARGVNWYAITMRDWIDPILQSYLASVGLLAV